MKKDPHIYAMELSMRNSLKRFLRCIIQPPVYKLGTIQKAIDFLQTSYVAITLTVVTALLVSRLLDNLGEAEWRIYTSANWAVIGSCNCLSPSQNQGTACTNAKLSLIVSLGKPLSETGISNTFLLEMNFVMITAKYAPFFMLQYFKVRNRFSST